MRFDYYACTIRDSVNSVLSGLSKLGHAVERCDGLARAYHYRDGYTVNSHSEGLVCRVFVKDDALPHAFASSDATDAFCNFVRSEWPSSHYVTRFDPCQDFYDASAFKKISPVLRRMAKDRRMSFTVISSPVDKTAGKTVYLGGKSSSYRLRLYEKGWEQYSKFSKVCGRKGLNHSPDSVSFMVPGSGVVVKPSDWIRLELQARPKGEEARLLAASCSPEQAWGFTDWTHCLSEDVLSLNLERIFIRPRKISTDERSLRWMLKQYQRPLKNLLDDLGGWDCVGLELGRLMSEIDKE